MPFIVKGPYWRGSTIHSCLNLTDTLHKRTIDYLIGYNLILTKRTFYTFVVVQGLWKRPIGQTPQWNIFKLSVFLKENLWCCGHIVRRPALIFHPLVELDISQIDVDFFQISVCEVWRVNAHVPNTFWYTLESCLQYLTVIYFRKVCKKEHFVTFIVQVLSHLQFDVIFVTRGYCG